MKLNSKGVSPLIATVLLLLVAVGVGAIIWTWVTGFAGKTTSEAGQVTESMAAKGSFEITSCTYSGGTLTVKLENTGQIDLNQFRFFAINSDGSTAKAQDETDLNMAAGATAKVTISGLSEAPAKVKAMSLDYSNLTVTADCTS